MKRLITVMTFLGLLLGMTQTTVANSERKNSGELGFNFSLKRIVYVESEKYKNGTNIELSNESNSTYLMSAAILLNDPDTYLPIKKTESQIVPFIILPPLYKFEPNSTYNWRVYRAHSNIKEQKLPDDRESLFWIAIQALPQTNKETSGVILTPTFYFKLLYRPQAIADINVENVTEQVHVSKKENSLFIENTSPLYITFSTLKIGDIEIKHKGRLITLAPFSTRSVMLPEHANGVITWQLSDENLFPIANNQ